MKCPNTKNILPLFAFILLFGFKSYTQTEETPIYLRSKTQLYGMNMKAPTKNQAQAIGAAFSIGMKMLSKKLISEKVNSEMAKVFSRIHSNITNNSGALIRINIIYDPITDNYLLAPGNKVSFLGLGFSPSDALSELWLNGGELDNPYGNNKKQFKKPQYVWLVRHDENILQLGIPQPELVFKEASQLKQQKIEQRYFKIVYRENKLNYNNVSRFWQEQLSIQKEQIENKQLVDRIQSLNDQLSQSQSNIIENYKKYKIQQQRMNSNSGFNKILGLINMASEIYSLAESNQEIENLQENEFMIQSMKQAEINNKYASQIESLKNTINSQSKTFEKTAKELQKLYRNNSINIKQIEDYGEMIPLFDDDGNEIDWSTPKLLFNKNKLY